MRLRGASSMKIAEKLGNKAAGVEAKRTVLASTVQRATHASVFYDRISPKRGFVRPILKTAKQGRWRR
jgi:hypothetical protein